MSGVVTMRRGWLIDTSALAVAHDPAAGAALASLLSARAAFTCPLLDAEALAAARSPGDYAVLAAERQLAYAHVPLTTAIGERVLELQATLARRAHLRAASIGDLVVAATALEHQLSILHHSRVFSLLGDLCGLDQRAIVPLGGRS